MVDILARPHRHLLLEEQKNGKNSFIANVNKLVDNFDIITNVGNHLDAIQAVNDNLADIITTALHIGDIKYIANNIPAILDSIDYIRTSVNTINGMINSLNVLTKRNEDTANRLDELLVQVMSKLVAAQNALDDIQDIYVFIEGAKNDINAALREALLPVITEEIKNEVVERASLAAVDVIEARLLGNTDFVQTYIDNYGDAYNIITVDGTFVGTGNTNFVGTYNDNYRDTYTGSSNPNSMNFVGTYNSVYSTANNN